MLPAHQRFDADDCSATQVQLGLVVQQQFVAFDGASQLAAGCDVVRVPERTLEASVQQRPVGQAGQPVVERLVLQVLLGTRQVVRSDQQPLILQPLHFVPQGNVADDKQAARQSSVGVD